MSLGFIEQLRCLNLPKEEQHMDDATMAALARETARALIKWARSRDLEDKKAVAQAQRELCEGYRAEEEQKRRQADRVDGYDRDNLGDSPDH